MSDYVDAIVTIVQQSADIDKVIEDSKVAEIRDAFVLSLESSIISKELVRTRLLERALSP